MSRVLISGQLVHASKFQRSKVGTVNEKRRSSMFRRLLDTSLVWGERIKQRRELQELANSPELLMDIGISRYEVLREGSKRFWQE
ncbi:DUF1127 domain-containing protein [Granulosicoccus antarcticus]|uniref:DUF1127 domain-containing protein n=1 Tax=Granulosicoccus antarcticus IMCC3135 TaxID=1192854 RepID=A0A2Z2NZM8_9GAMM|nr:DUF1127 domain-containing protein [Granulosicoccus antarcticus]ASJ76713.1 hypothetical protein IMCC3135_33345 [Granulosicoccus antarcticus IMCC3135]